jgi:hypothetical protein
MTAAAAARVIRAGMREGGCDDVNQGEQEGGRADINERITR